MIFAVFDVSLIARCR